MKIFINLKNQTTAFNKLVIAGLYISIIGLISSCSSGAKNSMIALSGNSREKSSEIVIFCGNPGAGKSSLLNSIVQQEVFESGINIGEGKTKECKSFFCDGITYMDTPGLSDVERREQSAKEIERGLKEDKNYKIVFVLTLESGRIKPDDLTTINLICDAVKTNFTYGLIINKVTKRIEKDLRENPKQWTHYLKTLERKPAAVLTILNNNHMAEGDIELLPINSECRRNLINFIAKLPANNIPKEAVEAIKAHQYDAVNKQMEEMLKTMREELAESRKMTNQLISQQMALLTRINERMSDNNKDIVEKLLDSEKSSDSSETNLFCSVM